MSEIIKASYILDYYPIMCVECPFHKVRNYRDGAYTGTCSGCELGYMRHGDTREFDFQTKRWKDCNIVNDDRVTLG